MKPNILIITRKKTQKLFKEKGYNGFDGISEYFNIINISMDDLFISEDNNKREIIINYKGKVTKIEDLIIKKAIIRLIDDFSDYLFYLIKILNEKGIYVLNQNIFGKFTKITGYSLLKDIGYSHRLIPTIYGYSSTNFRKNNMNKLISTRESIMKGNYGFGGDTVCKYENFEKDIMKKKYTQNNRLMQNYIDNDGDIRVMICGEWIFGYKRRRTDLNSLTNNVSLGGKMYEFKLPEEIKNEVKDITKKLKGDYIGFDYIYDKNENKRYILEMNETCIGTQYMDELFNLNPYVYIGKYLSSF